MKKLAGIFVIFIGIGVIILLIFNYRYPFINPSVGNWSVGYRSTNNPLGKENLNSENVISYEYIDSIVPEEIDYIADPFFIKEKDTIYLFVELKGQGNANIALLTSIDGNKYKYDAVILDEPFHLSYPQVFKHQGRFYMLPETKGSNHLLLYEANNFPYNWAVVDTLLKNIGIKDPSLLLSEDLNLIVGVDDNLKQYMFVADSLHGTWAEAPNYKQRWGNETRPGGRFISIDEEWYLPLQNRSMGYGTGISLFKLINSNGALHLEKTHPLYLGPQKDIEWFNRGMHHLDIQPIENGYYMVYDGDKNLNNEKVFQYKRTIKFNLLDIYNLFR